MKKVSQILLVLSLTAASSLAFAGSYQLWDSENDNWYSVSNNFGNYKQCLKGRDHITETTQHNVVCKWYNKG